MSAVPTGGQLIREIFRRRRKQVVGSSLFWAGHQICEAMVPVAIGLIIDEAVGGSRWLPMVISVAGLLILFMVLSFCWRSGMRMATVAQQEETHELRLQAVRRILAPAGIDNSRTSGELLSITTSDTERTSMILMIGARIVSALAGLVVSAVLLIRIDWLLGLVVMVAIPLLALGLNALGPLMERRSSAQQQAAGLAASMATDLLRGLRPLRGFGGEQEADLRYRAASQRSLEATVGAVRATATFQGVTTFATGVLLAIVAALAGWFALQGRISIGELITVVGLAQFVREPVAGLGYGIQQLATSRASAERVAEILRARMRTGGPEVILGNGRVAFEAVSAGPIGDLSFAAEPGEVIGVVADDVPTADTITGLLSGSMLPDHGRIALADQNLGEVSASSRRAQVLVEPHRVDLFGETLRDALLTGRTAVEVHSDAEIHQAMRAAAAEGLVDDLDRPLLDHGMNLSGGQRQRVAMARALLDDRSVLVLRDPTTAVDAVTETAIAAGIRDLRSGTDRVTIMVATSPPLLAQCDRVIFIEGGRLSAAGTHAELLQRPGYAAVVLR